MGAPVPIVPTYKIVYMKFEKSEPQSLEVLAKDAARLTEGGYLIEASGTKFCRCMPVP